MPTVTTVLGCGLHQVGLKVQASTDGSEAAEAPRRMPIFPLPSVGIPGARMSLHVFEARYRVLFNTLLAGLDDVRSHGLTI